MKTSNVQKDFDVQCLIDFIQKEIDDGFELLEDAKQILDNFDSVRILTCAKEMFLHVKQQDEKVVT